MKSPQVPLTPYQKHRAKWKSCTLCPLCETRQNVVLAKGQIPCDVLCIGEAPGASEDSIGTPFCGPAGHLLDKAIAEASSPLVLGGSPAGPNHILARFELRLAFTNLVACIPLGEDGDKVKEPPPKSIEACSERLDEFIRMCHPRLIVAVGKLPTKWLPKLYPTLMTPVLEIIHPAAILRSEIHSQTLLFRRCVVSLADAFAELI